MDSPFLKVENLTIGYGEVVAVHGISFEMEAGEFLTLLGPSGCGKSTTLRCIAGLETQISGSVTIDGEVVASSTREVPPEKRGINMVFQSYAVWPHMTVAQNVGYGLTKLSRQDARTRTEEALELVGLSAFASRYGTELSGGQQQRVAVARAIVTNPKVILFDEPLSNLDAGLRERMRYELRELQLKTGVTAIYVTHDQTEAMSMSDRVILMNNGKIEQMDKPLDLYTRPRTAFAARFLGHANLVDGTLDSTGTKLDTIAGLRLSGEASASELRGGTASAVFRPENVRFGAEAASCESRWTATVERVSFLGRHNDIFFRTGEFAFRAESPIGSQVVAGDEIEVGVKASDVHFVPVAGA